MDLARFVPSVIRAHDRPTPWEERSSGTALFADVSGFTPMSEALARLGPVGAELLTAALNRYFDAMIAILAASGGEVMKFGGDAILCLFSGPGSLEQALAASLRMQARMGDFACIRTPVGRFALRMKIGLAEGPVVLAGLGDRATRCDFAFAGPPVDGCADAEHHASQGEIVLASLLPPAGVIAQERSPGFFLISAADSEVGAEMARKPGRPTSPGFPVDRGAVAPSADLAPYLIREIATLAAAGREQDAGSLVEMVPVFVRFGGFSYDPSSFDLTSLHAFFSAVVGDAERLGGRLNRISMGDKGSSLLILFGAPNSLEGKEELAAQWATESLARVRLEFPHVTLAGGMSVGRVFAGIVGGSGRYEYTVMGDVVNLAARFMQGASEGQFCLSGPFAERVSGLFDTPSLGMRRFKGKIEPQEVFALGKRKGRKRASGAQKALAGRSGELALLEAASDEARSGKPAFLVLEGEPGIGKSALLDAIAARAELGGARVVRAAGDLTERHIPYAPWRRVVASTVFADETPSLDSLRSRLTEARLDPETFLPPMAGFLGVLAPSPQAPDDDGTRQALLRHAVVRLLLAAMADRPTILLLDSLQWFDTLSLDVLLSFPPLLREEPLLLLAAARPGWARERFVERPTTRVVPIPPLDGTALRELAVSTLGGPVTDDLVGFLHETTSGNPFFAGRLLEESRAAGRLTLRMGEWTPTREARRAGTESREEILLASLERLAVAPRSLARFAACLGTSFSPTILGAAAGRLASRRNVEALLASRMLEPADDGGLAFVHSLIQGAIYRALPLRDRRRIHRRIAVALERAPASDDLRRATALAHHFTLAGDSRRSADYSLDAGRRLLAALSFPEAADHLEEAERRLRRRRDERRFGAAADLADAQLRAGRLREAKATATRLARAARRVSKWEIFGTATGTLCHALVLLSDYSFIGRAPGLLALPIPEGSKDRIRYFVAFGLYFKGRHDEAEALLEPLLSRDRAAPSPSLALDARIRLVAIARIKGEFARALALARETVALAEAAESPLHVLKSRIELATALEESGDPDGAATEYQKVFRRAEEIGDLHSVAVLQCNWALLQARQQRLDLARNGFAESSRIFAALGARNGQARAGLGIGLCHHLAGDFPLARSAYLEALSHAEAATEGLDTCEIVLNLAEVAIDLGQSREARDWLERGYGLARNDPAIKRELDRLFVRLSASERPSSPIPQ